MSAASTANNAASPRVFVHPALIRITHWLNALAVIVLIGSGWRIYNGSPVIAALHFPPAISIGGDPALSFKLNGDGGFGNALLWHFAAMWLLVANGIVYVVYGFATKRFRRKLAPIHIGEVADDLASSARLHLSHDDLSRYNALQKPMYLGVSVALAVMVTSGLAIWKPVQLQWLTALLGGFQGARTVHFIGMSLLVLFLVIHLTLSLLVPRSVVAMITGRAPAPKPFAVDEPPP